MIKLDYYKGKKFGVLGLGKSGLSVVESLIASKIDYICHDDNPKSQQQAREIISNIKLIELTDYLWTELDIIVASPGIDIVHHPLYSIITKYKIPVVCDIELLYNQQHHKTKFLAITGTNGKSTTTSLTNHILQSCKLQSEAGGNIGNAALTLSPKSDYYVLELSSYQLDLLDDCKFDVVVLMNITPDHLERYKTLDNYIASKMQIFNRADEKTIGFINIDNENTKPQFQQLIQTFPGRLFGISTETIGPNIITLKQDIIYDYVFENQEFPLGKRKYILGKHNDENIIASYSLAKSLNLPAKSIISAILDYKGLEHRMEFVTNIKNTTIINDSKATNSDSTEKALLSYDNIYWIAGGLPKTNGITDLVPLFPKIKKAYLIGTAKYDFSSFLSQNQVENIICKDLKEATELSLKDALENTEQNVVLLSPACASWDEWPNFEVRGNHFKQYIFDYKSVAKLE